MRVTFNKHTTAVKMLSSGSARRQKQRKVLLMGKSGAGKSSMRSIVFSNYVAKDVRRLGATIDVEHSNIRFMGNLMLNLWDCGGQDGFTESYLTNQRSSVFASVAVLIFVFDVESREFNADLINYASIVQALRENSPQAKIFVLIHKMDLIMSNMRDVVFAERSDAIRQISIEHGFGGDQQDAGKDVDFWGTSIWDQSLYKAWTQVIYYLVPNAGAIENLLRQLAEVIDAHELILYERTTCLMVTHVSRPYEADGNPHPDRFERLSSILKSHKHSVAKHTGMPAGSANFAELQIKTGEFMFLITRLSENTNLAVVMGSGEAMYNAARINITNARDKFAELDIASKSREKAETRA
ncbi:GTP-binding protein GTR1 [Aureobasidium pullulans]|uniref:GTP-binding protein n=2 Tax=Aureobasidium pullulans TaxID=5580 RepID=A0A4T0C1X4_AURPU|nr:GTP-binding protein GTR1 [Aureobasidium pullulans]THY06048.1 GTP-binding protein GTR1 [Aureobasidium pullulans]THZ14033.1 GTP-binding protein GTR1 [Aureobasidium pullulans]THZ86405.1 GTP-binding protein GTR1 [Aureobasidium pullulans]THZ90709.1 GTP-binding protein GTR1 [Aureobasidium pullulans]